LRQDPDVIMVGEIRDSETAEIAVNAALTGHLVFSTLHTNNAAGTFPRLIDLGVNPKVITSAISIAMAQRLVRVLCPECKKQIKLEGDKRIVIERVMKTVRRPEYQKINMSHIYESVGCKKCNGTGFKGRIGIFEAILSDGSLEQAVLGNPSEREIRKATEHQNILTMLQDGVIKTLQGITTVLELARVIDLEGQD